MDNTIRIQNLKVSFYTGNSVIPALGDVTLELRHNEVSGIIGETGCGKSVLGLALLRLLGSEPEVSGKITLGDLDINSLKGKQLRYYRNKLLALIPQNPSSSLNPVMRIGNQVNGALTAIDKKGKKQSSIERIFSVLGFKNTRSLQNSYPFQLSGGMRERVLVSLGLIRNPLWLLADEPTKGLDLKLRIVVGDLLHSLIKDRKGGVILITHDIDLAKRLCQRIIVMYGGSIVEDSPCRDIMKNPLHPYSKALLQALPENGFNKISGPPLGIGSLPEGCRFYPRCSVRMEVCKNKEPPLYRINKTIQARCFLYA